jgi:hypothetical protein
VREHDRPVAGPADLDVITRDCRHENCLSDPALAN